MRIKEELALPLNDREAIEFALYHLDPLDIPDFLVAWINGESVRPYLEPSENERLH